MSAEKQLQYFKVIIIIIKKEQSKLIESFLYERDEIFIKHVTCCSHASVYG